MEAKELAITILGLAATFLMPWPGAPDRDDGPTDRRGTLLAAVTTPEATPGKSGIRSTGLAVCLRAVGEGPVTLLALHP